MKVFTRTGKVAAVGVVALFAVAGCASAPTPSGTTTSGSYVALGDSFTANSFHSPGASSNGCDQTGRNQPHVVQARMGFSSFVDASCDGATSDDIMAAGTGNAAQISFVTSATKLVTLSIGGNDIGFSDIVKNCTLDYLTFGGCKGDYVSGTTDQITNKINAAKVKIQNVVNAVKARAPQAKIFIYGYPTLVPMSGTSGCTGLTLASGDISYLRSKQAQLNSALSSIASGSGATYVDVYGPSAGHDPCSDTAWVARVIDLPPVHPTSRGVDALADLVADSVQANF